MFPATSFADVEKLNVNSTEMLAEALNQGETNTGSSPFSDTEKNSDLSEENTELVIDHAFVLKSFNLGNPTFHLRINMLTSNYSVALPPPEQV